jgi:hypothetical protein
MSGVIPPLPQYAFMAWCSVKAQGQLYFILLYHKTTEKRQGISTHLSLKTIMRYTPYVLGLTYYTIYKGVSKSFRTQSVTK